MDVIGALVWTSGVACALALTGAAAHWIVRTLAERRADRASGRTAWLKAHYKR